jgi:hypothetical protein
MRRRLDLAAALVADPEVLFLDEPTTGLDPRSRMQMWETIQELVRGGSTVLLTTQYMEEADRLADDIVVIDHGRKIAQGTANALKAQIGGERVEVILCDVGDMAAARSVLGELSVGDVVSDEQTARLTAPVTGGVDALKEVLHRFGQQHLDVYDVGVRRPTLDDVFLSLTGHVAEEAELRLGHLPDAPIYFLSSPRLRRVLRVRRSKRRPQRAVALDVVHRLRTFQICSIGQRRAHSVCSAVRYVDDDAFGGRTSTRSSTSKPAERKSRIQSPYPSMNSTAPSAVSHRYIPK